VNNKSSCPPKPSRSVRSVAERLARADGVSLDQFIAATIIEKVGTLNTTERFLELRAVGYAPTDLHAILNVVPDTDPIERMCADDNRNSYLGP